jgi:hypothetical protein
MKSELTYYCCDALETEINDPRVFIDYNKKTREYFIETVDKQIIRVIYRCPWCGKKLPKTLRKKWFLILEKEYGIDDPLNKTQINLIPEEFKTDEWWIKRGL